MQQFIDDLTNAPRYLLPGLIPILPELDRFSIGREKLNICQPLILPDHRAQQNRYNPRPSLSCQRQRRARDIGGPGSYTRFKSQCDCERARAGPEVQYTLSASRHS